MAVRAASTWIGMLDLCFFQFNRLLKDDNLVPKHVGDDTTMNYIL